MVSRNDGACHCETPSVEAVQKKFPVNQQQLINNVSVINLMMSRTILSSTIHF